MKIYFINFIHFPPLLKLESSFRIIFIWCWSVCWKWPWTHNWYEWMVRKITNFISLFATEFQDNDQCVWLRLHWERSGMTLNRQRGRKVLPGSVWSAQPDVYLLMRSELINLSSTKYQCWPTQSLFLYSWKLFGRFQFHKVAQPTSPQAHCSGSAHLTSSAITPSVRPGQAVSLGLADWPDVSRPGWASLRWAESDKNVSTLSCYNNQEKVWEEILNLSLDCSLIQSDEGQQISISTWSCLGWAVQIIYLPLPDLKCNFHFPSLVQVGRQAGSHVMSTPW